jgi:small subunit ribosomal protein S21
LHLKPLEAKPQEEDQVENFKTSYMSKKQKHHKSIVAGTPSAIAVVDRDISFALRSFKRKMKQLGVLDALKENRTFTKPSVKRRAQLINAKYMQKIRDIHQYD